MLMVLDSGYRYTYIRMELGGLRSMNVVVDEGLLENCVRQISDRLEGTDIWDKLNTS